MPMGARKDLGRVCPPLSKHALPAKHLTIECRMNEQKKAQPMTPQRSLKDESFNPTLDMVAGSYKEKCGLKYVIHIPRV
jgi:hypothetical protein